MHDGSPDGGPGRAPPGRGAARAYAGVCHGTLGELFQGPLRYEGVRHIALVSFPVARHAWAYFVPDGDAALGALPAGEKSARAVRLLLERHGRALPPGRWHAHSELDVGVGMASSTADIVASLRCASRVLGLPLDRRAVQEILAGIERADSVFLDEFAVYLSARHRVVRGLGPGPALHAAFVTEPGTVDTGAVTPLLLPHYERRHAEYDRTLTDLVKGFTAGDARAVARAATASAALSQEVLPKAAFDEVLAHREGFGADGVFVAHTGSLLGYLFSAPPPPALKGELSAFFRSLGHQCSFARGGCP
ncbi:hypothetical protein V1J52_17370 [Streptomyces sp. TRM 70351]|uniref:GHMP family kinase ATP-binding protein n=1 Tax=Streptomyces sp. TRM 70351 TaxID=3116552 RepID=UPI002E7B99D7|nr:hypothetical protein [Streptomyces sp. TRM 70351]MEE1929931.1 hypothetical protein [Streptomyces sp. TRM 70351]